MELSAVELMFKMKEHCKFNTDETGGADAQFRVLLRRLGQKLVCFVIQTERMTDFFTAFILQYFGNGKSGRYVHGVHWGR